MRTYTSSYVFIFVLCFLPCLLCIGCQDLFTTQFFSFMQRDPGDMERDELIRYGWDVIGAGDTEKMLDAYNAVKDMLSDTPDDGELAYLGAKLAIEMSGLGDLLINPPETDMNGYKSGLTGTYIMEAGQLFTVAAANGNELNGIDMINCGIGLLLTVAGGDFDVMETMDIDNPGPLEIIGAGYIDTGTAIIGSEFRDLIIVVFFTIV